jgi:hypothetical protein
MGRLVGPASREPTHLPARLLIGRSAACGLRLAGDAVSQEHAVAWWEDGSWWIRDLASRNGTRVDGTTLRAGESRQLERGSVIEVGDASQRWILDGDGPPEARAVTLDGTLARDASRGLLGLPDEASPLVVIHRRWDGRWIAEEDGGSRRVDDLEVVTVDGRSWRLHLPEPIQPTLGAADAALRLPDVSLAFHVSAHEEHVDVTVANPRTEVTLPSRVHLHALLVLARARLDDARCPEEERGWLDRERLCAMLALDRLGLNIQIHRARRQFAEAGVENVGALVERRPGASELRLGVAVLSVGPSISPI